MPTLQTVNPTLQPTLIPTTFPTQVTFSPTYSPTSRPTSQLINKWYMKSGFIVNEQCNNINFNDNDIVIGIIDIGENIQYENQADYDIMNQLKSATTLIDFWWDINIQVIGP